MEQHREIMRSLLNSRVRRESKRDVSHLTLDEVLGELGYRGCALDGPDAALRERLLCAPCLGRKSPKIAIFPATRGMTDEREPELGEDESRDEIEVEQEAGRGDGALGARREGTASPNGEEQRPNMMVLRGEDVVVHVPVVSATTSSPIVMQPVTTVATSASSTATSMRMTPGITQSIFSTQPPPASSIGPRLSRACGRT